MRGISGFHFASLADDTYSSITAISGNTTDMPATVQQVLQPMPANCIIHAVEVIGHRSGTFSAPLGAGILVDLFRGSTGQFPLRLSIPMSLQQYIATVGSAGLASFSGEYVWDRPWHYHQLGLSGYTGLANSEAAFGPSQTNAIYGRVKVKCGGAITYGAVLVHWETAGVVLG